MAFELRLGIRIGAPREKVFEHMLTPHHMARWFCSFAQVEPKPGGRLRFGGDYCVAEPPEGGWHCTFTGGEVRKSVMFTWPLFDAVTTVTWALEDTPEGCMLRVTHASLPRLDSTCGTVQDAWRTCVGNLKAIAEGRDDSLRPNSDALREPMIKLDTLVNAPPGTVFAALVEPDRLRGWDGTSHDPVVEPNVDGRYGLAGEEPGTIAALEPPKRLAVDQLYEGRPTRLTFDIEEKSEGRSGLHFRHQGFAAEDVPVILRLRGRWTDRFVSLKNFLEAGETGFTEPYEDQVASG